MTETDPLERLARLRDRRGQSTVVDAGPTASSTGVHASTAHVRPEPARRTPAHSAKILTTGVTATAVLAMIATYGAFDRPATAPSVPPEPAEAAGAVPASTTPTPSPPPAATSDVPSIVVVVLEDGTVVPGTPLSKEAVAALITEATAANTARPRPADASSAGDVPTPATVPDRGTVDLAVPAPPRAETVAAPAPPVAETKAS